MTQENKMGLTPDELAMLDRYVEFGLQNYFETITSKKVREAINITEADAKKLECSDEFIKLKDEISKIKSKFVKEREFGFYKCNDKNKYDEEKTKAAVKKWAQTQPQLKSLSDSELWERYKNKEFGFKTFTKFYEWHKEQPKECHYCKITQDELDELWDEKLELISSKKFSKALHIERLDPDKPYCKDNCRLACAVCNNAKSDLISESDFRECFVDGIKEFYKLLKSRLKK